MHARIRTNIVSVFYVCQCVDSTDDSSVILDFLSDIGEEPSIAVESECE